jgi:hypothetical protein
LEATESVFDAVSLSAKNLVVWDKYLAAVGGRDAAGDAALGEHGAEPVAVVATVGE